MPIGFGRPLLANDMRQSERYAFGDDFRHDKLQNALVIALVQRPPARRDGKRNAQDFAGGFNPVRRRVFRLRGYGNNACGCTN